LPSPLLQAGDRIQVEVYNDSTPMTTQDMDRLFKKFSRLDKRPDQEDQGNRSGIVYHQTDHRGPRGQDLGRAQGKGQRNSYFRLNEDWTVAKALDLIKKKRAEAVSRIVSKGLPLHQAGVRRMATCEIAAGSKEVMEVFKEAISQGRPDGRVPQPEGPAQAGANLEPTVEGRGGRQDPCAVRPDRQTEGPGDHREAHQGRSGHPKSG